ncbi:uncharacterized protein LOC109826193 [Asparagus officinalis]|uniref:uncharacterized protein LOC109826193 n=1 Tax=Asparagus officinalis TaxID=4686 RepID=UPI00098DE849|nr:uncharacterized protein LOC109826193 [Asparagus officinalis]
MSIVVVFVVVVLLLIQESSSTMNGMSAYDVLRSHGLPIGLLPKSTRNSPFDPSGSFDFSRLADPCTANFETVFRYAAAVNGTISYGKIASLRGVEAQELFLWFPVHEIRVDVPSSGLIHFDVGVIHKQLSLSLFETPQDCVPCHYAGGNGDGDGSKSQLRDGLVEDEDEIAVF